MCVVGTLKRRGQYRNVQLRNHGEGFWNQVSGLVSQIMFGKFLEHFTPEERFNKFEPGETNDLLIVSDQVRSSDRQSAQVYFSNGHTPRPESYFEADAKQERSSERVLGLRTIIYISY